MRNVPSRAKARSAPRNAIAAPTANAERTPRSSTSTPPPAVPAAIPTEIAVPNHAKASAAVPRRAERSIKV